MMTLRLERAKAPALIVTLAGLTCSCSGLIGDSGNQTDTPPGSTPPGDNNNPGNGNPTLPGDSSDDPQTVVPIAPQLRRLTAREFYNTVVQGLGTYITFEDMPVFNDDIPTIGLNNDADFLGVDAANVSSIFSASETIAQKAVDNHPDISACVSGSGDACFGNFAAEVGRLLWRRPLTGAEIADLESGRADVAAETGTREEQAEFLLQALLLSPNMMYRPELGSGDGNERTLAGYELASALSFALWHGPPDERLLAAAEDGTINQPEVFAAEGERLAADPKFGAALADFYLDYLKLDALADKDKDPELGLTPEVRRAMYESAHRDITAALNAPGATLFSPFQSMEFSVNAALAPYFGVSASAPELSTMTMDDSQRLGVLSHPAFLSVHAGKVTSGIVKRGVFTLEQLLCIQLGMPPDNVMPRGELPEGFDPDTATSREVLHVMHSSQPTCNSCHQFIDPAGFGYENYDGAGRYRTIEKEIVQIDASGTLDIGSEVLEFEDSVSYIAALTGSGQLRRCVADALLAYILGNQPGRAELNQFYSELEKVNATVEGAANVLISTPSFTTRIEEAN